jgi:hypothetical protein
VYRTYATVANSISSAQLMLNGGPNQVSELHTYKRIVPAKDAAGKPKTDANGDPETVEREIKRRELVIKEHQRNAEKIAALHPFPNGLFPMNAGGGIAAGMAGTLLRKRLEPVEEAWLEDRLRKAGEWCFVPEEWGVEAKKPDTDAKAEDEDESEEEEVDQADRLESERIPTTRVKDTLSEDSIIDLWQNAHQEVFDQAYLRRVYGTGSLEEVQTGAEGEELDEEGGEDEEEDDEEFEDVMDTSGEAAQEDENMVVVKRKAAAGKMPVHQPDPGLPVLSMGFVHKFGEIGEV